MTGVGGIGGAFESGNSHNERILDALNKLDSLNKENNLFWGPEPGTEVATGPGNKIEFLIHFLLIKPYFTHWKALKLHLKSL